MWRQRSAQAISWLSIPLFVASLAVLHVSVPLFRILAGGFRAHHEAAVLTVCVLLRWPLPALNLWALWALKRDASREWRRERLLSRALLVAFGLWFVLGAVLPMHISGRVIFP